jgi:hypothetical protein
MASTLDLYIDTSTGALLDGGSVAGGSLPTLTRNDSYTLRLRLLEKSASGALTDIDTSGASLKVGIGNIEELPTDGAFKLTCNGTTSGSIAYNATAISVYNAISNNVSTVSLYGSGSYGSYLLTATQPNTAMSFGADSFTLFPASSVIVNTRRNPATGVFAQQVVKLVRDPIVYADSFTDASTAGQIVLSKISDGGQGQNETYNLSFGQQIVGGLYSLNWGGTSTTGIAPFASAITVQSSISAGINTITSNISVEDNGKGGYTIQFTGRLAQTNITTPLQLDASGINFLPLKQTTLTINTSGVEDAFAVSGEDTITPTIEIEITQNGTPKTIYQGNVTIRKDLITAGAVVPGDQAQYYTKAESNALFFPAVCGGFNFNTGALLDATSVTAINYNARNLVDAAGNNAVSWGNGVQFQSAGLGFYGATPIAKPDNVSLLSAISALGLIGTGVSLATGAVTFAGFDGSSSTTFTFTAPTIALPALTTVTIGATGLQIGTTTSQKIGFFNATPIVQPVSTNVISALTNLGLIATTVTLGPVVTLGGLSGFVQNTTTNVDATNRILFSSSSVCGSINYAAGTLRDDGNDIVLRYGNRNLKTLQCSNTVCAISWAFNANPVTIHQDLQIADQKNIILDPTTGTKIGTTTSQKLAFYNSTPIVQPSGINAVSGLINLGLLASSATYGVLPQSNETLTVTTSINFGTVPNNGSTSITITMTGASVNDTVLLGLPATISEGLTFLGHVVASGQVHVDAVNATNSSIATTTATYRITVIGY